MNEVTFVAQESITSYVPIPDGYKFKPKGRAQWLQKMAWRFLNWRRALEQAYEPKVEIVRHRIDSGRFIDRLLKQKRALFDGFHEEGQRLLIGSEDYAELMDSPEIKPYHFSFDARVRYGQRLVGLEVEVVP